MAGDEDAVPGHESGEERRVWDRGQPRRDDGGDPDARGQAGQRHPPRARSPQPGGERLDASLANANALERGEEGAAQDAASEDELDAATDVADRQDHEQHGDRQ